MARTIKSGKTARESERIIQALIERVYDSEELQVDLNPTYIHRLNITQQGLSVHQGVDRDWYFNIIYENGRTLAGMNEERFVALMKDYFTLRELRSLARL